MTNSFGRAKAPTFTANEIAGDYMVVFQATGGSNPSTTFDLTNTSGATTFTQFSVSTPGSSSADSAIEVALSAPDAWNTAIPYASLVGRAPDARGEMGWADLLASGGNTPDGVAELFLTSSEFFARAGTL